MNLKDKQAVLPWVTDWTSPQNHIRYSKNVKAMRYHDWFYCHPSAYKIVTLSTTGVPLSIFLLAAIFFYIKQVWILTFGFLIPAGFLAYFFIKNLQETVTINKNVTIYDRTMREWPHDKY